jgi:predicted MFS family arabinose efflux permease
VVQVLVVTTVLLIGHQATYTYLAPIGRRAGLDRPGLTLLVFGAATAGGVAITAVLVDRHLRAMTTTALGLVTASLFAVAVDGSQVGVLLAAVAVWGLAFGGLPTALLTGLIRSSGEQNATTAGSLQATVYNVGVASGSLVGGLVLDRAGAAALPWLASGLVAMAMLLTVGRRARGFGP